jgi:pimeloyl-ACP methyl ester carboxylesterase
MDHRQFLACRHTEPCANALPAERIDSLRRGRGAAGRATPCYITHTPGQASQVINAHSSLPTCGRVYWVACTDLRGHGGSETTFTSYGDEGTAGDVTAVIGELGGL